jgi:hypothetical protein
VERPIAPELLGFLAETLAQLFPLSNGCVLMKQARTLGQKSARVRGRSLQFRQPHKHGQLAAGGLVDEEALGRVHAGFPTPFSHQEPGGIAPVCDGPAEQRTQARIQGAQPAKSRVRRKIDSRKRKARGGDVLKSAPLSKERPRYGRDGFPFGLHD